MTDESRQPGSPATSGLVLALELLVIELARTKTIDAARYVKELNTASASLGRKSDAARLLKTLADQLRIHAEK